MMLFPPLVFLVLYVALCWLLGYLGRHAKFGFWGNFWVGIIFMPIIGVIVLLAQDLRQEGKKSM
jgi:hypothetical protein